MNRLLYNIKRVSAIVLFQGMTSYSQRPQEKAAEFFARGYAYSRVGNLRSALQDFNKAIEINPEYEDAYLQRSSVLLKLGKPEDAIQDALKALDLNAGSALCYLNMGMAYEILGNKKEAKRYLRKAVELGDRIAKKYLRTL